QVKSGTAPDALNQRAEMPWGSLTHRVELKNLQPGTTYYFVAIAGDARGNGSSAQTDVMTFRTPAAGEAALRDVAAKPVNAPLPAGSVGIVSGPTVEAVADSAATVFWVSSA